MEHTASKENSSHIDQTSLPEFSLGANTAGVTPGLFPDYVEVMGLDFDPFALQDANSENLYLGAGRQELIDQIVYLSEFSAGVLVVSGDDGAGKTALFSALPTELDEAWQSCSVTANDSNSANQIFYQLASALDAEISEGANPGELLVAIRHQLTRAFSEPFILLVDNAHLLEDAALSALMSLLQSPGGEEESPFHVVLFGDDQLIVRLDHFSMVDVLLHDIPLDDFTVEDIASYLQMKLRSAGWVQPLPFSDEELAQLLQSSGGRPGRIHQPASQILAARITVDHQRLDPGPGLPVAHMFSLVVLLGVLVMAYFYKDSWFGGPEAQVATTPNIEGEVVSLAEPAELANEPELQVVAIDDPTNDSGNDANPAIVDDALIGAASNVDGLEKFDEPSLVRPADEVQLDLAPVDDVGSTDLTAMAPPLESLPPPAAFGAPASVLVNTPDSGPMEEATVFEDRLSDDERSIMAFEGGRYVLQVMAAGSKSSVERFVATQVNRSELHMYTTWRQGKPWYVVVAGNYRNSAEARAGVSTLPSKQKNAGPWPRPVADIQTKIKEFRRI